MQQRNNVDFGERLGYLDFQHLTQNIDTVDFPKSVQRIASLANRICGSVLPCAAGGIGVFDPGNDRVILWIPLGQQDSMPADYGLGSDDYCPLNTELLYQCVESQRFVFVEDARGVRIWRRSQALTAHQVGNLLVDGLGGEDDSLVCFYYLVNTDQKELPKYQIIMQLLLSSLRDSLLRLAAHKNMCGDHAASLTDREHQIIIHIRAGLNNKVIADKLNISINTVKSHIYNIFQKLNARNRVEALVKAKQAGYLL